MSIINDDDDLEEVEEEEREEGGPIKENIPPPIIEEPPVKNNFAGLNVKRKVNKKANEVRFLITFALNNKKTLEEISRYTDVSRETGRRYLNGYVSVLMDSLERGRYPDSVLQYYNVEMPKGQHLTVAHMEALRPVIIKYNGSNIESLMRQMGHAEVIEEEEEEELEEEASPEEEILEDYAQNSSGQFKEFNEAKQQNRNITIRALNANSSIQDIIRFGIHNCGQPDDAKIRKVIAIFMNQPQYYLSDESVFVGLLEANLINAKTIAAFMNWFKNVAPLSPQQRQGFLALNNTMMGNSGMPSHQPQQGQKKDFNNFDINDYDEFAQYLYQQGIYKYGLPPTHRVNQESYEEYLEEKRQEKIEKQNNRQFNNALKQRVLEMQSNRFMGGGGSPQQQQSTPGIALDEKYLLDRGMVVPEITYDMYGNKTTRFVPTGKTVGDVYGVGGGADPSKPDQFLESVSVVTRLIEALKPALNMGGGSQNPLMDKFMEAAIGKLINKAEESPTQVLDRELGLFDRFTKIFPQNGGSRAKTDAELQAEIRLKEIEQDGAFAEREITLKQKDYELRQEMMRKQEEESKNGIEMILSWIGKGFEMVSPILNSVLMGNMGGGIGNILGGMMPGGGPGGGMMGGGGGMGAPAQPFIPPQPQNEFEVTEPNSFIPPPTSVPPDFLPQQAPPEYTPQPAYEQQPPPVYEPQQQQYYPPPQQQYEPQYPYQQQEAPPPQQQEDDFLDSITVNDLDSLSVGQLDEISNRIETKASKIERLLNSIKTTKVRKQFGYNKPLKKTIKKTVVQSQTTTPQEDYSILNIPPTLNPDYDGTTGTDRNLVEDDEFVEVNDSQPTFLNYDTDMYSMGNDNQQFNQQNDANQQEYIAKISAQQKAENLRLENERRKVKGLAPLSDGTVVDETGRVMSEEAMRAADNKVENSDEFNDNPKLDETKTHPSDQYNKEGHKTKGKGKDDDDDEKKGSSGSGGQQQHTSTTTAHTTAATDTTTTSKKK